MCTGYVSYRHPVSGSPFVQVFTEVLKRRAVHDHLTDMMLEVGLRHHHLTDMMLEVGLRHQHLMDMMLDRGGAVKSEGGGLQTGVQG